MADLLLHEKSNLTHKHNQLLQPCGACMPRVNDITISNTESVVNNSNIHLKPVHCGHNPRDGQTGADIKSRKVSYEQQGRLPLYNTRASIQLGVLMI